MSLAELVIRTARIERFAPHVELEEPLLRVQLLAHDMGHNLKLHHVMGCLTDYARVAPYEETSPLGGLPAKVDIAGGPLGDWQAHEEYWPGRSRIGGLEVKHGNFMDIRFGYMTSSMAHVWDRDGSGKNVNLHCERPGPLQPRSAELLEHELLEGFTVAGVRVFDPHAYSEKIARAFEALVEEGWGGDLVRL